MGCGCEKGTEVQWNDDHIFKNWVVKELFCFVTLIQFVDLYVIKFVLLNVRGVPKWTSLNKSVVVTWDSLSINSQAEKMTENITFPQLQPHIVFLQS